MADSITVNRPVQTLTKQPEGDSLKKAMQASTVSPTDRASAETVVAKKDERSSTAEKLWSLLGILGVTVNGPQQSSR